jgi:hypothetical protein
MQLDRPISGVCSGSLHDFRWEIVEVASSALASPVGVIQNQVLCTLISSLDGNARAAILSNDRDLIELEVGTYLVGAARDQWAVGIEGFGKAAFLLSVDGVRSELVVPDGVSSVDIDCVNSSGVVGGSVEIRGEECGAVWRNSEFIVYPEVRTVSAIGEMGELFGNTHTGVAVRMDGMFEFAHPGRIVAVNLNGDALVSSLREISIWRSNGGIEAVAIRGYERLTALGWSDSGVILGFGMNSAGKVEHWIFDQQFGLRVLTHQALGDDGLILREVGAIGKNGELAGTAIDGTSRYLVRLF